MNSGERLPVEGAISATISFERTLDVDFSFCNARANDMATFPPLYQNPKRHEHKGKRKKEKKGLAYIECPNNTIFFNCLSSTNLRTSDAIDSYVIGSA